MKKIITYGTFDLFHIGHLNLFRRLKAIGEHLIVGVSTDEFNASKGKKAIIPFEHRIEIVKAISFVDLAIPEESWDQKRSDIQRHSADIFAIGDDWAGKFDELQDICEVVYLPRTADVSSTDIRQTLAPLRPERIIELRQSLSLIASIVEELGR